MTREDTTKFHLAEIGFLRLPKVLELIPIGKSTLWKRVAEGTFPKPIKLSERTTAWRNEDIRLYINELGKNAQGMQK